MAKRDGRVNRGRADGGAPAPVQFDPVQIDLTQMPSSLDYQIPTRIAALILKKDQAQLVAMLEKLEDSTLDEMLSALGAGRRRFDTAASLCESAIGRIAMAAETLP